MKEMALQGVTIELHWYSNGTAFHLEIVSFLNSLSWLHKSLRSAEAFLQVRSMHVGAHLCALPLKGISTWGKPSPHIRLCISMVLTRQVLFIRAEVRGRKSEKNKQVEAFVRSVIYTSIILLS